jgi:phosphatidylglycerol:prolipoprotein diacylglycerol transferase
MYPYITFGVFHPGLGTFGLFLWLAAVLAGVVLHQSFMRDGVDADALNVVCLVVLAGVMGAKTWHELQDPALLKATMHHIFAPGMKHFGQVLLGLGEWMRSGIAWFGGLLAGIAMLLWQGKLAKPNGFTGLRAGVRMLDLAAAATPVGYGIGRIGCLTSGDGDYGRNTTSTFWGVHMAPDALVPPHPANSLVLATPIWELAAALLIAWIIWRLGAKPRPLGWLTGVYLTLSGLARFTVEFWRINPKLYPVGHPLFSNAQVAALGSVILGGVIVLAVWSRMPVGGPAPMPPRLEESPA